MSITAKLDREDYRWIGDGQYLLNGWAFCEGGAQVSVRLLGDGTTPLPCARMAVARPDVKASRKDLPITDDRIGFSVRLDNLHQIFETYRFVRAELVCGRETQELFTRQIEEMKAGYKDAALIYFIDNAFITGENVLLAGWILDACREEKLSLRDETGAAVPCFIDRMIRNDVTRDWDIPDGYRCGFKIVLKRKEITAEKLVLHMENAVVTKEYAVDMAELDRNSTRIMRLKKALGRGKLAENKEILKKSGIRGLADHVREEISSEEENYAHWLRKHSAGALELGRQSREKMPFMPLLSIVVPLYNTPEKYLCELIDSVRKQSYKNWELCLADGSASAKLGETVRGRYGRDKRVRYRKLEKNEGIAGNTNAAIEMAEGDFLVFSDHDDLLAPAALYEIAKAFGEESGPDIVYTDEDLVDETGRICSNPRMKPDFNLDFLRSINYICHIFAVRRSLALGAGLLKADYDGAQDHEFILRCCERTKNIVHIPKVLYHWRAHAGSTAGNQNSKIYAIEAARRGLTDHYRRLGMDVKVEYTDIFIIFRTYFLPKGNPLVSVIIPNKDQARTLDQCLRSVFEKTDYPNYEIVIVENNSTEPETFAYYEKVQREHANVRVVTWKGDFNYSAINNLGVREARGEYLLFLNNDIEVITPSWMSRMTGCCQRPDVGAVGAKLYYPDDTVQHGGIVVGIGWFAGHVQSCLRRADTGYFGRLVAQQDISAVTGACVMVKRSVFEEAGGFEEKLAVALNDVDLCLKIRKGGHLIVFDPAVELYHYESKSRGMENTPEKQERFRREIRLFRERWKDVLDKGDPYYSPNLTLCYGDCTLRRDGEVPEIYEELFGGKNG